MWKPDENLQQSETNRLAVQWFENKLNQTIAYTERLYENYKLAEVLMTLYNLIWNDFASWYLEIVKPKYDKQRDGAFIDPQTLEATKSFFDRLMRLLHPFMPFITEEIWQRLYPRKDGESIVVAEYPEAGKYDEKLLEHFEDIKRAVSSLRALRKEYNIKNDRLLSVKVRSLEGGYDPRFEPVIKKLAGVESFTQVSEKPQGAKVIIVKTTEYGIELGDLIDIDEELKKLREQLDHQRKFLASVEKKLNNPNFVNKAPKQVVEREREKQQSAIARIKTLEEQIAELEKSKKTG